VRCRVGQGRWDFDAFEVRARVDGLLIKKKGKVSRFKLSVRNRRASSLFVEAN